MRRRIGVPVLFGVGALIGTAADQIHVQSGISVYPRPSSLLFGQAWWVPLLFGAAGLALASWHAVLLRLTGEQTPRASSLGVARSMLWFLAVYASTAAFQHTPLRLTLALVLVWIARVATAPTKEKVIGGPILAVGGSLFEAALSSTGAFHYQHPDVLLVPAWLPALYLHASLLVREACLAFIARPRAGEPDRGLTGPTRSPSSSSRRA
jgi:hypothetical protein